MRPCAASVVLGLLLACGGERVVVPVEPGSPAIREEKLTEAVGIEMVGGKFVALLEAGCELPCESTATYSTAADKPGELSLALFRGGDRVASNNTFLGRYVVSEIGEVARGVSQVELTLRADATGIQLSARDVSGGSIQLRRLY